MFSAAAIAGSLPEPSVHGQPRYDCSVPDIPEEADEPAEPRGRRRVLAGPGEGRQGRSGCLVTGAVLGVVVGAIFAFYGLPPILRAVYGETRVAAGATYEGDGKAIRVESVRRSIEPQVVSLFSEWVVTLTVTTGQAWEPEPADWRLEVPGVDEWLAARDPGGGPEQSLRFAAGAERTLVLRFPRGDRQGGAPPKALHLGDPRVRFDLGGLYEGDTR